ncbi:MAG: hypothetical protein WAV11_02800 [Minisyncoccia bacterium]
MSIRISEVKPSEKLVTEEIGRSKDNKAVVLKINGEIIVLKSSRFKFSAPEEGPPNILSKKEIQEYKKKSDASKSPACLAQERKDDRKRCKLWKEGEKYQ